VARARSWQPDVVQLEYHVMGQYIAVLRGCAAPRILVEYEPGVQAASDARKAQRGLASVVGWLDEMAWRRYERAVIESADSTIVFTERDRQVCLALNTSTPIVRIRPGSELPESPLRPTSVSPPVPTCDL